MKPKKDNGKQYKEKKQYCKHHGETLFRFFYANKEHTEGNFRCLQCYKERYLMQYKRDKAKAKGKR